MTFEPIVPTSDILSNEIDEKSKQIAEASSILDLAIEKQYQIRRRLLEISETVRKGKYNLARLKEERDSLTRAFWRSKDK